MTQLVLASRSPRRAELLTQIGVRYAVQAANIDETPRAGEPADAYVRRMAEEKADAVAAATGFLLPVLGADTSVVRDGEVLGKPEDRAHARAMLEALSDRSHEVMSAVAVMSGSSAAVVLSTSRVTFGPIDSGMLDAYLATDEPWDKAGAYGIQGWAARFVAHIEGSYSGVVGLPLYETTALLRDAGVL